MTMTKRYWIQSYDYWRCKCGKVLAYGSSHCGMSWDIAKEKWRGLPDGTKLNS